MLTGKKLLLADDSAAIQKVIDLTFSDEGMNVTTVGDGRAALGQLEQFPVPDIVLADASMPEMGGFELCQIIKRSERFSTIPVMLLVSSFEPFDEAQARAAGADDVVSKPFQSIRDLVSRVGALIGESRAEESRQVHSTLGLNEASPAELDESASRIDHGVPDERHVTVMVEAPQMEHHGADEPAGATCVADMELQTADTKKLERVIDEPDESSAEDEAQFQDTIEVEPVNIAPPEPAEADEPDYSPFADTTEIDTELSPIQSAKSFDEELLELDDAFAETMGEDVSLDLDFDGSLSPQVHAPPEHVFADTGAEVALVTEVPPTEASAPEDFPGAMTSEQQPVTARDNVAEGTLSDQAIDAIARRVVEQMSDKVVREIAWEVVPELSEMLIKKKLDEQK